MTKVVFDLVDRQTADTRVDNYINRQTDFYIPQTLFMR